MNIRTEVEDTGKLEAFREEVRAWIAANLPASVKEKIDDFYALQPRYPEGPDWALWKDRVKEKGWWTPSWPKEYGGGGLPTAQARIVEQEIIRMGGCNPMLGMGTRMLGPTLLEYG